MYQDLVWGNLVVGAFCSCSELAKFTWQDIFSAATMGCNFSCCYPNN